MRDLHPPVWRLHTDNLDTEPLPESPHPRCRALVLRTLLAFYFDGEATTEEIAEACQERRLLTDLTPAGALYTIRQALKPIATTTSPRAVRPSAQAPTEARQLAS